MNGAQRVSLSKTRASPASCYAQRMSQDEDDGEYQVVLNDEEQYSIWPADRAPPAGWRVEGTRGPKSLCLKHIDEVWTDMRPLSLRKLMDKR
jgi:MbtH protein